MSDKDLVQARIDELNENIKRGKETGKTYRRINSIIEDLFTQPLGSQIHLIDDPKSETNEELKEFVSKFSKRMMNDFPDTSFKISYPSVGVVVVTRTSETYQEIALRRVKEWENKLKNM